MRTSNDAFQRYVNSLNATQLYDIFDVKVYCVDGDEERAIKEMKECLFGFLSEQQKQEVINLINSGNDHKVLPYLKSQITNIVWEGCRHKSGIRHD